MTSKTQSEDLPQHIAIILDGNRRWARARGLPTFFGHKEGMENVRKIIDHAIKRGVSILTLFSFSTENWQREAQEVSYLLDLFAEYAEKEALEFHKRGVRFRVMGELDRFPPALQQTLQKLMTETEHYTTLILNVCLSYGGRNEIVRAVKKMIHDGIGADQVTEELLGGYLDSVGLADPDLVIRTSGEQRLSGFLTWQSVYSELYFTPLPWPAFNEAALDAAIEWYGQRDRRFGK